MFLCVSFTSVILWIGDLNYRISDLDVDNVKELISKKDFETLHNYDQVKLSILCSLCFVNSLFLVIPVMSADTEQLHNMVLSSRDRSTRRLCLLAFLKERLISSPPTNMTLALTNGIQGNFR